MASFALKPFLIWLLCIGIAALAIGLLIKSISNEGFTSTDSSIIISACPAKTTTYITPQGDTNCCDGDIVDDRCNGRDVCSLSPSSPNGLMSCADWIIKEWKARSRRFCTKSMPYYFGTMDRNSDDIQGCSASRCTPDGGSPQDPNKPKCKIYETSVDDYGQIDSCFNAVALDKLQCPIATAKKDLIFTGKKSGILSPALLRCTYIPPNGSSLNVPVHCNDVDRFETYINTTLDKNYSQYISLINTFIKSFSVKDVTFCPASKAFYVDGTLARKDAFGVPGSGPGGSINAEGGVDAPAACPTTPASGGDPRCYVNGVLVGTPYTQWGNKYMAYTEKECKQLGGVYDGIYCSFSADSDPTRGGSYNDICGKLSSNSTPRQHPKCLVNGVKLGTRAYGSMLYTPSECSQLGGIYDPKGNQGRGSCSPSTNSWHSYNQLCFENEMGT
jgi:hypothetical protein